MIDESQIATVVIDKITISSKRRFIFMISSSIFVSMILVTVGMWMYGNSGAAQLDLSRPGYNSVRSQAVTGSNDLKYYSNIGSVDQAAIDEFKSLFDKQKGKIDAIDAFGGDPLNPSALGISSKSD